jgi:catechol 2,3-dioxygenase-like lactoylglutathione lyase family enzyme
MVSELKVDRLFNVGVVVRSLEAATLRYAEIFGMDEWDVREYGPEQLTNVEAHGRSIAPPRFRTATATTTPPLDTGWGGSAAGNSPVTFELVEPLSGESPFQEFRFVRRQGISHLKLSEMTPDEFAATRVRFANDGISVAASMTINEKVERHYLDTRTLLGGYLVEIDVALDAEPHEEPAERWNLRERYTRPDGVPAVAVFGVNHFGIVVDDVMASLERYHQFFGLEQWTIRDWRAEPGSLECPFYRGEPVEHEYLTGLSPCRDFGFEIIHPTFGPSHYNREFYDLWGEGIHHMLLNVSSGEDHWNQMQDWLASIDVPVVMGGSLGGGFAEFCYYDTMDALGGYILEAFVLKSAPSSPPPVESSTHFQIDFAALASGP